MRPASRIEAAVPVRATSALASRELHPSGLPAPVHRCLLIVVSRPLVDADLRTTHDTCPMAAFSAFQAFPPTLPSNLHRIVNRDGGEGFSQLSLILLSYFRLFGSGPQIRPQMRSFLTLAQSRLKCCNLVVLCPYFSASNCDGLIAIADTTLNRATAAV
jgi:hypothetical protein